MKKSTKRILLVAGLTLAVVIMLAFFGSCLYQFEILQKAHSSFENYYSFRGCVNLVSRGPDYGYCSLANGQIIKIVQYQGGWYLDGDLPRCFLGICF